MTSRLLRNLCVATLAFAPAFGCSSASCPDGFELVEGTCEEINPCRDLEDGSGCGEGSICLAEACVVSDCGDSFVDEAEGEACDDGNSVEDDGCRSDCSFTCANASDCDDEMPCTGAETCSSAHRCVAGTPLEDQDACEQPDGEPGACRGIDCVALGCGNGLTEEGETCDDGNAADGDGCDVDCTYSCTADEECQNDTVCDGAETCDVGTHACEAGEALDCEDTENFVNGRGTWQPGCTVDTCDPIVGCQNVLRDEDEDGFPPATYTVGGEEYDCEGSVANDCRDLSADVYPGAEEICDSLDNNCNTTTDETAPTWFADCDGDGYALLTAATHTGCTPPANTGCPNETVAEWTATRPAAGNRATYDCNDANLNVRPGQTTFAGAIPPPGSGYDWNCDGTYEQEAPTPPPCTGICFLSCINFGGTCSGGGSWDDGTAPSCGNAEPYDYCERSGSSCGVMRSRTQRCR